jgi:hypothetical protein
VSTVERVDVPISILSDDDRDTGAIRLPMAEVINTLVDPRIREDHLHEHLFGQYGIPIKPTNVLSPTPAIALAGYWSPECLREVQLPEFLAFTAGLVMPQVIADAQNGGEPSDG